MNESFPVGRDEFSRQSLSCNRRTLVDRCKGMYGIIRDLHVSGGEPVFEPEPKLERSRIFGRNTSHRTEPNSEDFVLKRQWVEFFEIVEDIDTGRISWVEIKDGIPFRMKTEEAFSPGGRPDRREKTG